MNTQTAITLLPYLHHQPTVNFEGLRAGPRTVVIGQTVLGENALLGHAVLIRGDGDTITIGNNYCMGANGTVHIMHEMLPTKIGNDVTAGRNTVIHACTVGDNCVFGDDVVILDETQVEDGVLVEAGSIVYPRSVLKAGHRYRGAPAKDLGPIELSELKSAAQDVRKSVNHSIDTAKPDTASDFFDAQDFFLANTAFARGKLHIGQAASVFFSCHLDACDQMISIGERTNVQDNTVIIAKDGDVIIGPNVTIGHNVSLQDCQIGEGSLIGIGARVASGTKIDADVLLAAGAQTEPGQHLYGGWMWGGSPAKPLKKMNQGWRDMIQEIVKHYCNYGEFFRKQQVQKPPSPKS